jgi:hypothetical protein
LLHFADDFLFSLLLTVSLFLFILLNFHNVCQGLMRELEGFTKAIVTFVITTAIVIAITAESMHTAFLCLLPN